MQCQAPPGRLECDLVAFFGGCRLDLGAGSQHLPGIANDADSIAFSQPPGHAVAQEFTDPVDANGNTDNAALARYRHMNFELPVIREVRIGLAVDRLPE